ncbi:28S ribosomal S31, mitochondrial [Pelobates cultripes]|uniref:Small ribosomal subunit protein mS31 n=1 Tax=Pelobates cultripes TaxID=61616 RepID=A0AAD1R726_PELCU|nr:28S ribosomal S31, mitochondrial [Pelobates cultripes]
MYRRIAQSLWVDGMWVTSRGVIAGTSTLSTSCRKVDHPLRWLHAGTVNRCDKREPLSEKAANGKQQEEAKEKAPEPSPKENLLDMIGGMKVEISSKSRFQALKVSKAKAHNTEQVGNMETTSSMFQRVAEEIQEERKPLSPDMVAAVSAVASSLPLNKKQVESELLQQLRKHEQETDVQRKAENQLSNIISEMKIGKRTRSRSAANEIRFDDDGQGFTNNRGVTQELNSVRSRRGLYAGKRLNIFPVIEEVEQPTGTESCLSLWDLELANQIATTCEQPPRNGFEEMIQWTKERKLWTFPIDNETGFDEEQNVEFHEHIFLDRYLEDFPKQGPIRHFMELVVCGLSKNPYISVKQKKDHIDWFRDYFEEKKDILRESDVYVN